MNKCTKNTMPPMTPAVIGGSSTAATMIATMTNAMIKFDIRLVNSFPTPSGLLVNCLKKNRYIK